MGFPRLTRSADLRKPNAWTRWTSACHPEKTLWTIQTTKSIKSPNCYQLCARHCFTTLSWLSLLPPSLPSLPTHAGLPYMCLDLTSCSLAGSWLPETHGTSLTGAVYGVKGCIFVLYSLFSFLSYHSVFLSFDLIHLVTTLMDSVVCFFHLCPVFGYCSLSKVSVFNCCHSRIKWWETEKSWGIPCIPCPPPHLPTLWSPQIWKKIIWVTFQLNYYCV